MVPEIHSSIGWVKSWHGREPHPSRGSLQPCSRLLWWETAENATSLSRSLAQDCSPAREHPCALPLLLPAARLYCLSSCLGNKNRRFRNCLKIKIPIPAKHLQRPALGLLVAPRLCGLYLSPSQLCHAGLGTESQPSRNKGMSKPCPQNG